MSFLSTIAKDAKAVFNWLTSAKGKAVVAAGEGVVEDLVPQLTGVINLANSWIEKAITIETIGVAAGSADGTGTQKAAAVITALTPQITALFPTATAAQIQRGNDAIVAFLQAFDITSSSTTVTSPVVTAATDTTKS